MQCDLYTAVSHVDREGGGASAGVVRVWCGLAGVTRLNTGRHHGSGDCYCYDGSVVLRLQRGCVCVARGLSVVDLFISDLHLRAQTSQRSTITGSQNIFSGRDVFNLVVDFFIVDHTSYDYYRW